MKELLLSFIFALVVGSALNGYSQGESVETNALETGGPGAVVESAAAVGDISDSRFKSEVLESDTPVLVDFWATWCGPCKVMHPVIKALATEYDGRVKVLRMDVDKNPKTTGKYDITEIPTFLFFKGGTKVASFTGVTPKERLDEAIKQVLK
jgi:thioredoxin 1